MSNRTYIDTKADPKPQPYRPRQFKIEITLDCGPYYRTAHVDQGGGTPPESDDSHHPDSGYGTKTNT